MCTCGKGGTSRRGLLAGMAAMTAFARLGAARAQAPSGGTLRKVSGAVTVNGRPAAEGAAVAAGDVVAAGADGEVAFTLGQDGFLLRSDGAVSITDSPAGRQINLDSGRLLSVFAPQTITLKTPQASVGIRGTAVYLEARPVVTNICVCYGRAVMTPTGQPGMAEEVATRHHDAPRRVFSPGHVPLMEPYFAVNHTDDELVMLEGLLGRVPPFLRRP